MLWRIDISAGHLHSPFYIEASPSFMVLSSMVPFVSLSTPRYVAKAPLCVNFRLYCYH